MIKKILKALLILIFSIIVLFLALVLFFRFSRNFDKTAQRERYEKLQIEVPIKIAIPDTVLDDSLRLNEIRYLATHNSYHSQAGFLQLAILDLAEPGEAKKLRYSHLDLYSQLDIGVRSFEFDLRAYRSGNIENIHVPLVDNRGPSPVFASAIDEMRLWSERHPDHVPIIVIMETKDDWTFLDPGIRKWTPELLLEVDFKIFDGLRNKLITPADIKGDSSSVREALVESGWPTLGESRGKFIFVFHESEAEYFNSEYLNSGDRISFFMESPDSPEASFILRNDPKSGDITKLIRQGFIVRTRADADCNTVESMKQAAISSGAHIVSTDYPRGYALSGDYNLGWNELLSRYLY